MSALPRIAIGVVQPETSLAAIVWALLDVLEREGTRAQTFHSRACFQAWDGATPITGLRPRHLDSWVMSRELCREIFFRAAAEADCSLVEGCYATALEQERSNGAPRGGDLDTLCDWLDLPCLAVVDASRGFASLPIAPLGLSGVLLDRVRDSAHAEEWSARLRAEWDVPVLGWLDEAPVLREMTAALRPGSAVPRDLCRAWGERFAEHFRPDRFWKLARRRAFGPLPTDNPIEEPLSPLRVAVAFDEAFHCYFQDTLDLLELHGATVRDFSPLRDEALPHDADVVYIGCGHPHEFAEALSANQCLVGDLRRHICAGKRVYAESGGLAYLCREIEMPDGQRFPMIGALPAVARPSSRMAPPQPVELTLRVDSWLGDVGQSLRGYRNGMWELTPSGEWTDYAQEPQHTGDLIGRRNAIGSRVHLNFAAQPAILARFQQPLVAAT